MSLIKRFGVWALLVLVVCLRAAQAKMNSFVEWVESIGAHPAVNLKSWSAECHDWLVQNDEWWGAQSKLGRVVRWSNYRGRFPIYERQDSLMHSWAITVFGSGVVERLKPYFTAPIDEALMIRALLVHDFSEAFLGDTLHYSKTDAHDVAEYQEFMFHMMMLEPKAIVAHQRAFLLQFAGKKSFANFPPDAQAVLHELATTRRTEMLLFEAIENLDYVQMIFRQYARRGCLEAFVRVMRACAIRFDKLAEELPGFREEYWSGEFREWCLAIIKAHEGKWLDKV